MYEPGLPGQVHSRLQIIYRVICAILASSRMYSLHQISFAEFYFVETRAQCDTKQKFTRAICTTHKQPQPSVIMAFRRLMLPDLIRWSCPKNTSHATTVFIADFAIMPATYR